MSVNRRQSRNSVEVIRGVFITAGRHHAQFMRPFEINATDDSIEDMLENLGNLDFDVDSIGGWGGDLISVSSQVDTEDEALIPHGWDGDRLRFFLHVRIQDRTFSDDLDFYITGFTENDSTYELDGGTLTMEPDTRMFINSIMRLRKTSGRDMSDILGGSTDDRLLIEANSHCLIAYTESDHLRRDHTDFNALRPYDIASKLDNLNEEYQMDARSDFSTTMTKSSRRSNSSANNYLGRTIRALTEAERDSFTRERWRNDAKTNPYVRAQASLTESDQSKCRLQQALKRETSYMRNGYITFEEAVNVFRGLDDERYVQVLRSEKAERTGRTSDLDGEGHGGSDRETLASYQAMNAISGIMMESCIMQASFRATTDRDGRISFSFVRDTVPVFFIHGMSEQDQEDNIFLLEQRLRQFVFDPLEYRVNQFDMEAHMDALGDSQFFLSIQGDKEAEFWAPTFADGSTSSLLTTRKETTRLLARDSKRLAHALLG